MSMGERFNYCNENCFIWSTVLKAKLIPQNLWTDFGDEFVLLTEIVDLTGFPQIIEM